jgi:hypothetical protein
VPSSSSMDVSSSSFPLNIPSRASGSSRGFREASDGSDETSFSKCLASAEPRPVDRRQPAKTRPADDEEKDSDEDTAPERPEDNHGSSKADSSVVQATVQPSQISQPVVVASGSALPSAANGAKSAVKPGVSAVATSPVTVDSQSPLAVQGASGMAAQITVQNGKTPAPTEPFSAPTTQTLRVDAGAAVTGQLGQVNLVSSKPETEAADVKPGVPAPISGAAPAKSQPSKTAQAAVQATTDTKGAEEEEPAAGSQPGDSTSPSSAKKTISGPSSSVPATGLHRPTASNAPPLGFTAVRPESAEPAHRSAAMERSTTTSFEAEGNAISAVGRPALEEGDTPGENSGRGNGNASSSDAERARVLPNVSNGSLEHQSGLKVETFASQSLDVEERMRLVEQVRKRIDALQVTNGRHEVTLRLSPEHLGDLRLTIVADRGQIAARSLRKRRRRGRPCRRVASSFEPLWNRRATRSTRWRSRRCLLAIRRLIKPAPGQSQGTALDFSMNPGLLAGERRFGSPLTGEQGGTRSTAQSVRADRSSVPQVSDAGNLPSRRRADGRLDYQV